MRSCLRKTGKNSGLPPSQTDRDTTAVAGRHGKGPWLDGEPLSNTRTREFTTPFGGYKQSSFGGRDNSLLAHDQYTEVKTIWLDLGDGDQDAELD